METNEKQKQVTDEYRSNWDTIFKKPKQAYEERKAAVLKDNPKRDEYHTPED